MQSGTHGGNYPFEEKNWGRNFHFGNDAPYDGPGNSTDSAAAIAVDDLRDVYVTGYSAGSGTGVDYATIKYVQEATSTPTPTPAPAWPSITPPPAPDIPSRAKLRRRV